MSNRDSGYYWIIRVKGYPWRIAEWSGGLWWVNGQTWDDNEIHEVYEHKIPDHK